MELSDKYKAHRNSKDGSKVATNTVKGIYMHHFSTTTVLELLWLSPIFFTLKFLNICCIMLLCKMSISEM